MNNKLILIEGIPGSGKSTTASKIKQYLEEKNKKVTLFFEGDMHPADTAWMAYIPMDKYYDIITLYPQYKDLIESNTRFEYDHAFVTYTKLGLSAKDSDLITQLETYEVYNGRVSLEAFKTIHMNRWSKFSKAANEDHVYIFECAYLQNHINELMGYYHLDTKQIETYMIELIKTVVNMNPKLIYLSQLDVDKTLEKVAKERVSTDKNKLDDWIDLVISFIENCPYGKMHGLQGFSGVVDFFNKRQDLELSIIKNLPIECVVLPNKDFNWEVLLKNVIQELD